MLLFISGITNFDLMGHFRSIDWLGNFPIILSYNVLFGAATALCLTNTFTASIRRELVSRLRSAFHRTPRTTSVSSQNNGELASHAKEE